MQRLGNVVAFYFYRIIQIRDGACDFHKAVIRAGGELVVAVGEFQGPLGRLGEPEVRLQLPEPHFAVGENRGLAESLALAGSRGEHFGPDRGGRFFVLGALQRLICDRRSGDVEVNAVQDRPRNLFLVAGNGARGAGAVFGRVAKIAAGAGVLGRDEHEPRGKRRHTRDARHRDRALFERLAERLDHAAVKLREFVQKQNAAVRERHFARPRVRTPAEHCGV